MSAALVVTMAGQAYGATFELLDQPLAVPPVRGELSKDGQVVAVQSGGRYVLVEPDGRATDLGDAHAATAALGLADSGDALCGARGDSTGTQVPALWTRVSGWTELDASGCAYGLDAAGAMMVGLLWIDGRACAFRWSTEAGLRILADGGRGSRATAVSGAGDVVVGFDLHPETAHRRPVRWVEGKPRWLAAAERSGEVLAVDAAGRGSCGQLDGHAFHHDSRSGLRDLGVLVDAAGHQSLATAISNQGVVVGWSGDPGWGQLEGFVWTPTAGMHPVAAWFDTLGLDVPEGVRLTTVLDVSRDGSTLLGIWQDAGWAEGLWRVTDLTTGDYDALPATSDRSLDWPADDRLPAPGRPVILR